MGTRMGAWVLWGTAVGFFGMARFTHERLLEKVALWPLALGLLLGVTALATGLHRWLRLPARDARLRRGLWFLVVELCILGLLGSSLALGALGSGASVAFELAAVGFLSAIAAGFARETWMDSELR